MSDLDTDQDWNPGNEKNKTELFFERVFKEEDLLDQYWNTARPDTLESVCAEKGAVRQIMREFRYKKV